MTFFVDPSIVERAARDIKNANDDAQEAKAYIVKHTDMPVQEQGLLSEFWPAHERLVNAMNDRLTRLVEVLRQSGDGLQSIATHYRQTDLDNAARLDATYPAVDRSAFEATDGRPMNGPLP